MGNFILSKSRAPHTSFKGSELNQNLLTFVMTASLLRLTQVNMRLESRVYQTPDLHPTVFNG